MTTKISIPKNLRPITKIKLPKNTIGVEVVERKNASKKEQLVLPAFLFSNGMYVISPGGYFPWICGRGTFSSMMARFAFAKLFNRKALSAVEKLPATYANIEQLGQVELCKEYLRLCHKLAWNLGPSHLDEEVKNGKFLIDGLYCQTGEFLLGEMKFKPRIENPDNMIAQLEGL